MRRTFEQLTKDERNTALKRAKSLLISHIFEGIYEIAMPTEKLQLKFDAALNEAKAANDPVMFGKAIEDIILVRAEVEKLALAAAEGTSYDENNELLKTLQ